MANDQAEIITLLVQVAAQEAPAIIEAVRNRGGSVANVGPLLAADRATINADEQQLKAEQAEGGRQ
jgi:hypothetical protein